MTPDLGYFFSVLAPSGLQSRLVAREEAIVGWAALGPVSKRACYAGVAEVGVYVAAAVRARGVDRALLEALIESSEAPRHLDFAGHHNR